MCSELIREIQTIGTFVPPSPFEANHVAQFVFKRLLIRLVYTLIKKDNEHKEKFSRREKGQTIFSVASIANQNYRVTLIYRVKGVYFFYVKTIPTEITDRALEYVKRIFFLDA